MFEVTTEEDQAFWEALPFETLEEGPVPSASNTFKTPVSRIVAKKHLGPNANPMFRNEQHTTPYATPLIKEDEPEIRRKASKRKFPGPAGNLPPNMPKETLSPEYVHSSPAAGPLEMSHDKEEEEPTASQAALEEAFASKAWKRLLSDLGPNAAAVLSKFSIKSMLIKANKRMLPRGKVPLILGYIERVDFQGTDGSIVLRDPSGKMNGSIHQDLIKDPSTALQVGWVLVLRQVSVISPLRNHYLNITSGNIVAVYRLNKNNEAIVTSGPSPQSSPLCSAGESCNASTSSLPWDRLIRESEKELLSSKVQNVPDSRRTPRSGLTMGQRRPTETPVTAKPGLSDRIQSPSPLFAMNAATTKPERSSNLQSYSNVATRNQVDPSGDQFVQNFGNGFDDDFPDDDDDSDILSFCDTNAFDEQCISSSVNKNIDVVGRLCDSKSAAAVTDTSVISKMQPCPRSNSSHGLTETSRFPNTCTSSKVTTAPVYIPVSDFDPSKKRTFSFKMTSSISSPSGSPLLQSGPRQETSNSHKLQENNRRPSVAAGERTSLIAKADAERDFKIQLGACSSDTAASSSKENQLKTHDLFGQWNDDLSDELLSQLTEDF